MVIQTRQRYTVEEFEAFANLPENADRLFEFIGGEIVEVPSNPYSSEIAALIIFFIQLHLREQGRKGHVTGEAGGYQVMGERYAPDVAFISYERQPELVPTGYNPNPPDLAIEVVSPTDRAHELITKVGNYLAAGTTVWVVYPERREVAVYRPGQAVLVLDENGTLDGGTVLPGLRLAVRDLFPAQE